VVLPDLLVSNRKMPVPLQKKKLRGMIKNFNKTWDGPYVEEDDVIADHFCDTDDLPQNIININEGIFEHLHPDATFADYDGKQYVGHSPKKTSKTMNDRDESFLIPTEEETLVMQSFDEVYLCRLCREQNKTTILSNVPALMNHFREVHHLTVWPPEDSIDYCDPAYHILDYLLDVSLDKRNRRKVILKVPNLEIWHHVIDIMGITVKELSYQSISHELAKLGLRERGKKKKNFDSKGNIVHEIKRPDLVDAVIRSKYPALKVKMKLENAKDEWKIEPASDTSDTGKTGESEGGGDDMDFSVPV
jgi:hypothetical protein